MKFSICLISARLRQNARSEPCVFFDCLLSELPVDTYVPLPFLMPVPSKASFCVCVKAGVVVDVPGAAETGFLPCVPVVFAVVHGFAVRRCEVEVSFPSEFVEQREFQVVVIGMIPFGDPFAQKDAQAADGAIIASHMYRPAAAGGIVFASQAAEDHLRFRFQEEAVVSGEGFAPFHGKAFAAGAVAGPVRIVAPGPEAGIIPSPLSYHVGVYTAVTKPGAVEATGKAVVFGGTIAVFRIGNGPLSEEPINALFIGGVVIAQLETVVPAVCALSFIGAMEIPGLDTGVILHIPEAEISHALSQAVNIQAVESIAVIGGFHERNSVFVHFLFQFREVPLFVVGIGHPHYIMDILPVLDGGRHIPEAAFFQTLHRT